MNDELGDTALPGKDLTAPARLGLDLVRADLAYITATLADGSPARNLTFLQHAVLVAFEAHKFCTAQLGLPLPALSWDPAVAEASRMTGKFFDDRARTLDEMAGELGRLTRELHEAFHAPVHPIARLLRMRIDDLMVLTVGPIPVLTGVSLLFFTGGRLADTGSQTPTEDILKRAGTLAFHLMRGVGELTRELGAINRKHAPAAPNATTDLQSWDGVASTCYQQVFAGEVHGDDVPLMILLQGAAAAAGLLARTDCCDRCSLAALKHRLVTTYHVVRSLEQLRKQNHLSASGTRRIEDILSLSAVEAVPGLRRLRNGLVHLGLSDVPASAFEAPRPWDAVVAHYTGGRGLDDVNQIVEEALSALIERLTGWMLAPPPDGRGLMASLRRAPGG